VIAVIIVCGIVEFWLRPRLDKTDEGDLLLWYGKKKENTLRYKLCRGK